ncbi:NADH-quinone oxidoreductase subunit G [Tessaracoccus sp. MC1865]|uniref:NADH-quinone oxidoreductase subunit G n=1 Tax=Tessaracoccus sp. MC1865 TaxID=2760310 RepID=UPI001603F0C8|nr:NADH-quinone oxidoreductase subunit G [Tessaracoccus sp. MC1865]MBB1483832.1 NADH-quinone oxidoreductase subunit G [Tessaracoccus sp. MC1865]QTO36889.1 NADH-quinone oxidoreductase subunit G [Tessaracoccus sp. MC1865]
MTVDAKTTSGEVAPKPDLVTLTIDGTEVSVPKGTLIIRAAEMIGTAIPRFCDHPLLDPVGACRQCMVDIPDAGNGRGFPKPQASCTMPVAEGMKVNTQRTSPVAEKAQRGMLEFLLINHPLDCPVCDKGGECPLQNQALANGPGESRFEGLKRTFPKPVAISAQILLDRERCVLCARCTRFSEQISGDPFIALVERGALQQVGTYEQDPYDSYFSGNVVQICPVGALTSAAYRFQARPFDLVSRVTTCEHCASGCELRTDQRHHQVKRRLAGDKPEVNEEWSCDKGRFGFMYGRGDDRITRPLVRRGGVLEPASWPEAIDAAVQGLRAAGSAVGVQTGGRLSVEASYAYGKFARAVLGTNNVDFRSRPASAEEADFLAARVAGRGVDEAVTYADLEAAKHVVLVSFEPEDESPIVFLRLRKAVRKGHLKVTTLAPFLSRGSDKLSATLVPTAPGREAEALDALTDLDAGSVILVGERAAVLPGVLSAAAAKADATGARLAWIPRRAGDVGAIEAGCLPGLLPGGRPVADPAARVDVASHWGVGSLPAEAGLSAEEQFAALADGTLKALVVAGVDPHDLGDPATALAGLEAAQFVVSIEQRASAVTARADVVFPAALLEEQSGHFVNWEHRHGRVNVIVKQPVSPMTDIRILAALADALGSTLGFRAPKQAYTDLTELGAWDGDRPAAPAVAAAPAQAGPVVAGWRELLDASQGNDYELALRATARPPVARVSAATAERLGLSEVATVEAAGSSLVLPVDIVPGMVDDVVWVPVNPGQGERLVAAPGSPVRVTAVTVVEGATA